MPTAPTAANAKHRMIEIRKQRPALPYGCTIALPGHSAHRFSRGGLICCAMTILLCSKDPLGPFDLESFANCPNVISATNSAILAARRPIPARDAARQPCSGASGKVATTTYASAVSRFRLLLQARNNSPHKREISMAKVSGVIPQHGEADSIGAKGAKPRRTARLLTP